jgi:hypothetical protein
MKITTLILTYCSLFVESKISNPAYESFKAVESQLLTFPLSEADYKHWIAKDTAILLEKKSILVPELLGVKGQLVNQFRNPLKDKWSFTVELSITNQLNTVISSGAVSLLYLKNVASQDTHQQTDSFGY